MIKRLARISVGVLPLFLFIGLLFYMPFDWVAILWKIILATTVLFYLICRFFPKKVLYLQSMPYTYLLKNNTGADGLHAQLLTYASYHTKWYNHLTHAAFPLEALMWTVLFYSYFGSVSLFIYFFVLCLQAASFNEKSFFFVLSSFWLVLCLLAYVLVHLNPVFATNSAIILLIACGFWRFTGHWVEPVPPEVLSNRGFRSISAFDLLNPHITYATLLGFTSEFAAGLPFRLVVPWIYVGLQKRFPDLSLKLSWEEAKEIRRSIHKRGWACHPVTRNLVEDLEWEVI